jgi:hypothetical protein
MFLKNTGNEQLGQNFNKNLFSIYLFYYDALQG